MVNNTVNLLGTSVSAMTMADVITRCDQHIVANEPVLIGVVNAAKLVNARRDEQLKASLKEADFIVADGLPVVWLSRLCGDPLPERVAGIDIMSRLLELANEKQYSVYFLGARQDVVEKVVNYTNSHYPQVRVAGYRDGYFTKDDEETLAKDICSSKADILFVAITSPKKEDFLRQYTSTMNVSVCHGVGGSFDVVAGVTRRAPMWIQNSGLEWLYRVIQEPRRMWKRYLVTNSLFLWLGLREILSYRFGLKDNSK